MEIWSRGSSWPLKCAMGAVMASSEEESEGVPAAGQEARDRHFLEGDDGKFGHRRVVARELHYPRFLTRGKRRHERLARLEHRRQAGEALARQREPDVAVEARARTVARVPL